MLQLSLILPNNYTWQHGMIIAIGTCYSRILVKQVNLVLRHQNKGIYSKYYDVLTNPKSYTLSPKP